MPQLRTIKSIHRAVWQNLDVQTMTSDKLRARVAELEHASGKLFSVVRELGAELRTRREQQAKICRFLMMAEAEMQRRAEGD